MSRSIEPDSQLDLFAGVKARDRALKAVAKPSSGWIKKALKHLEDYPDPKGTGEAIRLWIEKRIGTPHHHNVAGAFIKQAIQAGILHPTGEMEKMQRKRSHARQTPVYMVGREG